MTTPGPNARVVLAAMTLANAMILVDQTAVPLALPDIQRELRVGQELVQWVLNASLLPLAGLLVLGGRLGDVLGRRRVFFTGALLFGGASAAGGLAPTFPVLLAARVVQGIGGAVLLPTTVAIVGSTFARADRGRALGTMGGVAAIAGALGPTLGGALTSALSWRAVLLVNVPLLVVTLGLALRVVPSDGPAKERGHVDVAGALWLCLALVGFVFGLAQTQSSPAYSLPVLGPLAVCLVSAVLFVWQEHRSASPLLDFRLLGQRRNYLGATISQALAGTLEMGLALILPLVLILNLGMPPVLAGLALLATTVPMVVIAPLVGRWYDRSGGRPALAAGFGCLAVSGLLLAVGVGQRAYLPLLPGLVVYGVGLAMVLTANDPVSLDMVPESDHGQASGVSATAEQFGGAVGIAGLYALFHAFYLSRLQSIVAASGLPEPTGETGAQLRDALFAAEETGLDPTAFPTAVRAYLLATRAASEYGYTVVFLAVTLISLVGLAAVTRFVRRPPQPADDASPSQQAGP